jgi:Subtilase family
MAERRTVVPRTYFLNETHEHARDDLSGGGRPTEYAGVDWAAKGERLAKSLRVVRRAAAQSSDPLRERRLFLLSRPEVRVEKVSTAKKAKNGRIEMHTDLAGEHARVFERLGLDLIRLTSRGDALVHAKLETIGQLEATVGRLGDAGRRDQARWALLSEFHVPPLETRVDLDWLSNLDEKKAHEVIIEFQPVLDRADYELVSGAVRGLLAESPSDEVVGAGRDLSGRRWLRARLQRASIRRLGAGLQSVQSIHAPLRSVELAAPTTRGGTRSALSVGPPAGAADLPAVAVVDAGIPREHKVLAAFRRGEYRHQDADQTDGGDHGSRVASRIVFGDVDAARAGFVPPPGRCKFLDVVVPCMPDGDGRLEFDDKAIFEALRETARNYRDVRVFNLSLGSYQPFARLSEQQQQTRLEELQDLDNFAFEHDLVVVAAAGNSPPGVIPNAAYPDHVDEVDWGLGSFARGFNTLVVGSFVDEPNTDGVARRPGWPSPFTRIGPGIADAPVPNLSASGGDGGANYRFRPGLGVWTLSQYGDWEDAPGTSMAAPIVAREAALAVQALQRHCGPGVQPFAGLVKAFLSLVARHRIPEGRFPANVLRLAEKTLGRGCPSAERLATVRAETAVFLWQGTLERAGHVARVRVPVPRDWLSQAKAPRLRSVAAWNGPVFAGAPGVWGCRRVNVRVRPTLGGKALVVKGAATGSYPIVDRTDDLSAKHLSDLKIDLDADEWVIELDYSDVGPYPHFLRIDEQQRVGLAIELFDAAGGASPQADLQSMPLVSTMIQLGGIRQPIWAPIRILT